MDDNRVHHPELNQIIDSAIFMVWSLETVETIAFHIMKLKRTWHLDDFNLMSVIAHTLRALCKALKHGADLDKVARLKAEEAARLELETATDEEKLALEKVLAHALCCQFCQTRLAPENPPRAKLMAIDTIHQPIYRHDCEACIFLGCYEGADLYFCRQHGLGGLPTVLARASDKPSDYVSGLAFAEYISVIKAAKTRAIEMGLLEKD